MSDRHGRALTDLVSRLGSRRDPPLDTRPTAAGVPTTDAVFPTRALPSFLQSLKGQVAPVVLDLGPVVGANVTFLGERLGCKLFVEDLRTELDRLAPRKGGSAQAEAVIRQRLSHGEASIDGVLCWDLLDYLEPEVGAILARQLVRLLRPGGTLLVCFRTEDRRWSGYSKYEIVDESRLRYRFCAGARGKRRVIQSREVTQMFDGLTIVDSFLLTSRMREMVFRKVRPAPRAD